MLAKEIIGECADKVRGLLEECDNAQGFIFTKAITGGTGSSLPGLLCPEIKDYKHSPMIVSYSLYPSAQLSCSVVEPYNAVLSIPHILEHEKATVMLDNEGLYRVLSDRLHVETPDFA